VFSYLSRSAKHFLSVKYVVRTYDVIKFIIKRDCLSVYTVHTYLSIIYEELGVLFFKSWN